ncbi:MAG: ATP-binding cassette domain-containing protein [Cyclobacteriaceae bacterium]|nr:ATP-binding cassette domain-containing protein [Cyclobacteriaceae bacterium]
MSEELLKAIIQLFAIVARERITDDERNNIKEFLSHHLNRNEIKYYLELFDEFARTYRLQPLVELTSLDEETAQFVDDWSRIMQIVRQVNQALTMQQKLVLVVKIIELVYADTTLSERQSNLIFYIGQGLRIPRQDIEALQQFIVGQDIDELASRNILIIDEGSGHDTHPGPRMVERNLTGLIAILRLPDAEVYFVKYLGISVLFLNSVPLRSRMIDVFPPGSTIRGNKIEPIYYSDVVAKFLTEENRAALTFTAEHIFYHFKSGKAGLQNINIAEKGAKLIGIMGSSGSGKSTLLNVLNGSEKPSSGRVLINGVDIHKDPDAVEGIIGYIPQDDLLMEDLTVFENLYYAGKLCFRHYTDALSDIRHLKVGNPLNKTISGGQRKRLNIGLELLREPTVLFVDEPTSGLSSRDSENIMDLLKELSLRGKMVFVVIHQPSSDIFKMFDTLIILDTGGFQIYYGNPVEAVIYFREIVNAANKTQGACPECGNINPEQIFNIIETKIVNEYGRLTNTRKVSAAQWYQYFKQRIRVPHLEHVSEPLPVVQKIPNAFKQFRVFFTRDVLSKLANRQYQAVNLLAAPLLALFISFMVKYYNVVGVESPAYSFYENDNIPVYFFMSVVVALFLGLTMSAEEIFRDRKLLKRERFLHLSKGSYLFAKIAVLFTISAIQTICFVAVGNLVLEIPLTELRYWFILFSCSCFANLLGLNISGAFSSAVTIYILIPILIIPQLLLSGVVIRFEKFNPMVTKPVGVPWIGEIMASRWAFEAFMVTQFKDNPFERMFYDLDKEVAIANYKRLYYIPALETKLAYALSQRRHWRNPENEDLSAALALLRGEIGSELSRVGEDKFPMWDHLAIGKFDSVAYDSASAFLKRLKQYYLFKSVRASKAKDSLVSTMTNTDERLAAFNDMRRRYVNEAVSDAVKNATTDFVVEYEGRLVQRIYPIYQDEHRPRHALDFSANLYQPTKHFLGRYYDTLYFNLCAIWFMTFCLFVTAYFDVFPKIIRAFERRKYRRV